MQKREQSKVGGAGSGSASAPPGKRGRPIGSGNLNNASESFLRALQSGLKSELTWALNTLTLLSFKEKEEVRRDAIPLAKIPGLLDAVLQIVDDWRDIALPNELKRTPRVRLLGANSVVSGFGSEYEALDQDEAQLHHGLAPSASSTASLGRKNSINHHPSKWWFDEDVLFNLDEKGRAEKQQCAVVASNIIRNFSFMLENEIIMAQHRHCLEIVFQCIEDHSTEDEELVTNALETIVNLAPLLDLRIFSSSKPSYIKLNEKHAVQAIRGFQDPLSRPGTVQLLNCLVT
ncbi:hypothetical protein IFM89_010633 [Coptis chinensis]|uniref:SWI/SNF-like complex subunit BAF250 C-terminal domain-containing protein n=1 Tax=Coptis chinensis TaxID=261450 RepID=A0A835M882_9MAGN|nr:hypothetical protein IFM89_010633 [Coptis chinensis]